MCDETGQSGRPILASAEKLLRQSKGGRAGAATPDPPQEKSPPPFRSATSSTAVQMRLSNSRLQHRGRLRARTRDRLLQRPAASPRASRKTRLFSLVENPRATGRGRTLLLLDSA